MIWDDIEQMFQNMRDHVQLTGDTIVSSDNHQQLLIGFKAVQPTEPTNISIVREVMEIEYPTWEIRLSTVKSGSKFSKYLKTLDTRVATAATISNMGQNKIDS